VDSLKETPGWTLQSLRSRVAKAEILSGHFNAKRVTDFIEVIFSVRKLFFPSETMYLTIASYINIPGVAVVVKVKVLRGLAIRVGPAKLGQQELVLPCRSSLSLEFCLSD